MALLRQSGDTGARQLTCRGEGPSVSLEAYEEEATIAIVAHALLSSMSVIMGAACTLEERWSTLEPHQRLSLLGMISGQSEHVSGVLRDLVLGLPAGVLSALESSASG